MDLNTYKAIDRDGRTVATVRAADREAGRAALRATVTEADCPDGWYLYERPYSWHSDHRMYCASATGEYFLPEDCGSEVTTCRGCLAAR